MAKFVTNGYLAGTFTRTAQAELSSPLSIRLAFDREYATTFNVLPVSLVQKRTRTRLVEAIEHFLGKRQFFL